METAASQLGFQNAKPETSAVSVEERVDPHLPAQPIVVPIVHARSEEERKDEEREDEVHSKREPTHWRVGGKRKDFR